MIFYPEEKYVGRRIRSNEKRHSWDKNIGKFDECNSLYVVKIRNIIYKHIYIMHGYDDC